MKLLKRLSIFITVLALSVGIVPVKCVKAAQTKIPDKARVYISNDSNYWASTSIRWESQDQDERVEHIKTNSKNVMAKLTYYALSKSGETNEQQVDIAVIKEGTYKVTFDIVKDSKVVSKHTVMVYAYPCPVGISLGNSKFNYVTGNKGKINVALKKGNTLKKIEYGVYQEEKEEKSIFSEMVYKTVKNHSTVSYSKKPYLYKFVYNDGAQDQLLNYQTRLYSEMDVRVTYKDKYTKQDETYLVRFYKVLDK